MWEKKSHACMILRYQIKYFHMYDAKASNLNIYKHISTQNFNFFCFDLVQKSNSYMTLESTIAKNRISIKNIHMEKIQLCNVLIVFRV